MGTSIAVPRDLYEKAVEFAAEEQVSVDAFVAGLISRRVADREFIAARARAYSPAAFERALAMIPDREPDAADRL